MDQEPPREPTVERVERADGRYILYFSWPQGEAHGEQPPEVEADDGE
jgi:hypothetical protein